MCRVFSYHQIIFLIFPVFLVFTFGAFRRLSLDLMATCFTTLLDRPKWKRFFRISGRQLANFNYQYFPGVDTHTTYAGGSILYFMTGHITHRQIYTGIERPTLYGSCCLISVL